MKTQILFILAFLFLFGCKNDSPKIYIKTTTIKGLLANSQKEYNTTELKSDYFEIGLYSYSAGYYTTKRELKNMVDEKNLNNSIMQFLEIVEKDSVKQFINTTQFLNYMSEGGYEMVDQSKLKYRTDYTFKKKP